MMIPIRFIPLTWASRYDDFKLLRFEFFDSLQFYCGFLTFCTLYLYTTLLVIIYFYFLVLPSREMFLFGFTFLSTSWFPLFPILIWLCSVFFLWTKKIIFLKPKLGDFLHTLGFLYFTKFLIFFYFVGETGPGKLQH